eukprot:gene18774-25310_t
MADNLIEQTRGLHEDIERLERLNAKDLKQEDKTHKGKLMQGHRVRKRLDMMQEASRKLVKMYEDDDNSRRGEIAALASADGNAFGIFYDRLKEVRDYHRRFPSNDVTEAENDEAALKQEPHVEFTGEEGLGRTLDLHEHFQSFVNAKFGRKLEYHEYLACFTELGAVPRQYKLAKPYSEYTKALQAYLESFYERTQPMAPLGKHFKKLEEELKAQFDAGAVPGWEDKGMGPAGAVSADGTSGIVDVDAFESPEELEMIGADRLKEALGLKCGGTQGDRAKRLFITKSTPLDQLDKKLFAKGATTIASVALTEAKIYKLTSLLDNAIADTKGKIEKKQTQTYEEMQAEQEEAEAELVPVDSDEEDEFIYNPLKLPLGWDGKPIPYWLYKLHGLNQEFNCEICGNHSYWGRRAFEKHFKEWRHQNGMRALGIPNNKCFYEVVKIEDALSLWKNMVDKNKGGFKAELDEEFEDAHGNVYNRKTYEDLKRQGLI